MSMDEQEIEWAPEESDVEQDNQAIAKQESREAELLAKSHANQSPLGIGRVNVPVRNY